VASNLLAIALRQLRHSHESTTGIYIGGCSSEERLFLEANFLELLLGCRDYRWHDLFERRCTLG